MHIPRMKDRACLHAEVWQTWYIYGGTPTMSKREGAKHRFCEWGMALSSHADQAMHAEVKQTKPKQN